MTPVSLTLSVPPVNMPTRLQCLDVPIVGDEECEKAYPGMITRRMMCAGYMDGGRDACNVSNFALDPQLVVLSSPLHISSNLLSLFARVTLAAPWCVTERSTAWCRGVRGVPCPTTLESTSNCVSSPTGSKTS